MKKQIFALIAAVSTMGAVHAQTAPAPYIGLGIASADHNYSISGATGMDSDGYKASGKVFGGVDFDKTWGLEAGYTRFGSASGNYSIGGTNGSISSKGHSLYLAGKATMPVNEQFSLFGKLGVARNKNELSSTTAAYNYDESKTEGYGAIGAQYNLSKEVALSLELERYGKNRDNGNKANVVTVAARYNF
jgi:hypothetical protein